MGHPVVWQVAENWCGEKPIVVKLSSTYLDHENWAQTKAKSKIKHFKHERIERNGIIWTYTCIGVWPIGM